MRKLAAVLVGFVLAVGGTIVTGSPAQAGHRYTGTINGTEYRKILRQWRKYNHRREVEHMANARGKIIWRDRDGRGRRLDAIVVRYRTPKRGVVVQIAYIRQHRKWRVNDIVKRRL